MKLQLKLKRLIAEKGLTQLQLSEITGLRQASISELINMRRRSINIDHLERVLSALGVDDVYRVFDIEEKVVS